MNTNSNKWEFDLAIKIFLIAAFLTVLIIGQQIFIPLTVAVFFSFLLNPVSLWLMKYKVPRSIAIIISIILALFIFGSVIYFFLDQLMSFSDDLPILRTQALKKGMNILEWIENRTLITQEKQILWMKEKIIVAVESTPTLLIGIFSMTGTFIAMLALIPFYIFFFTYFKEKYNKFIVLVSNENHEKVIEIIHKISVVSQKYLKGVLIDIFILSVLGSIGYLLLGIEHAILFAVIAAFLNIIPYVGVLFGSLLPIIMALITKDDISYAFGALGVAFVVQFIDNNIVSPYVIGSSVSLNPVTAIIALLLGGMVWGIPGMILSVPLTGMLKVVFDNIESLKPWGYLLGEEKIFQQKKFFKSRK